MIVDKNLSQQSVARSGVIPHKRIGSEISRSKDDTPDMSKLCTRAKGTVIISVDDLRAIGADEDTFVGGGVCYGLAVDVVPVDGAGCRILDY